MYTHIYIYTYTHTHTMSCVAMHAVVIQCVFRCDMLCSPNDRSKAPFCLDPCNKSIIPALNKSYSNSYDRDYLQYTVTHAVAGVTSVCCFIPCDMILHRCTTTHTRNTTGTTPIHTTTKQT